MPALGRLLFVDLSGEEISGMEVSVVARHWIAVPTWRGFNGNSWIFRDWESGESRILEGIWRLGDPVGMWQCQNNYPGPELAAWKKNTPLSWHSSVSGNSIEYIKVSDPEKKGLFLSVVLQMRIQEPGVFLQGGRVVGWTFGSDMERGFMWNGPPGKDLKPELTVDDFYDQTFANFQEAQFSRALSLKVGTPAKERLGAIVEGFRQMPQLEAEDKPLQLHPISIRQQMQSLALVLLQQGKAQDMLDILDEEIILETADTELLSLTVQAHAEIQDIRKALDYLNRIKRIQIETERASPRELELLQLEVCKKWISASLEAGGTVNGWIAYESARKISPDDPELRLLGTELAITEKDWGKAENLLHSGSFPQDLKVRAQNLEGLLIEGQSENDMVQIRFLPGQDLIPVEAFLEGKMKQKFLIDTGASMVSIPSATADALGIRRDDRTPVVPVTTASGQGLAYEVTLDRIEIKSLRVRQVKAIVLDLPGNPEVGLLGNNFLKHFHVEIDQKKGILRLGARK